MDFVTLTSYGHAESLQAEMARMRERHALCDLTIQISDGVEYAVHKVVLVAHSRYFRMQHDCGQLQDTKHIISNIDSSMFSPVLHYLYTGELHITPSNIRAIVTAATQLDIPEALNLCQRYLQNMADGVKEEAVAHPSRLALEEGAAPVCRSSSTVEVTGARRRTSDLSSSQAQSPDVQMCTSFRGNDRGQNGFVEVTPSGAELLESEQLEKPRPCSEKPSYSQRHLRPREQKPADDSSGLNAGDGLDMERGRDWQVGPTRKQRKQTNPSKVVSQQSAKDISTCADHARSHAVFCRRWLVSRAKVNACTICGKSFAYKAMLHLHLKRHRLWQNMTVSRLLYKSMMNRCEMRADSHQHKKRLEAFTCNLCAVSCVSAMHLHLHKILHHRAHTHMDASGLYRCSRCPRTFLFKKTFSRHLHTRHNPGPRCENCGRYIRPAHILSRHLVSCYRIRSHKRTSDLTRSSTDNKRRLSCSHCGRRFKYQKACDKHIATCSRSSSVSGRDRRPRSYPCQKCTEKFSSLRLLQQHQSSRHAGSMRSSKQFRRPYAKRCKSWDCEVDSCTFRSSNPHDLNKHVTKEHPHYSLPCKECRYTAGAKSLLERHMRMRHLCALKCESCDQSFSVPAQLRVHRYIKHKIDDGSVQVHSCPVAGCEYTCVWKSSLKVHMQRHEIGKPFTCQICDKKFKREKGMQKHINKVHKGIRPYMCDICGQSYGEDAELKVHMVRHSSDKQYKCEHCSYATHDKGNYQSHLFGRHRVVISNDMTIFTCNVCDYTTDRKHRYEMHMKNHMGIRDITCKLCGKSFVTKNTLSNHIQRVHSEKIYTCSYCQYTTGNNHTYKEHVRVMHTHRDIKPYKCAYCDFRCHTSGNCRKHCANRHKGLEIKWVRLCELYTNGIPLEPEKQVCDEERPIAESNIKHISIARRISKDVVSHQQQQQHQQQPPLPQQQQQPLQQQAELQPQGQEANLITEREQLPLQPQQQHQHHFLPHGQQGQQSLTAVGHLSSSTFQVPPLPPTSHDLPPLPGIEVSAEPVVYSLAAGAAASTHQPQTLDVHQSVLHVPHLPITMVTNSTQEGLQLHSSDMQQPFMALNYPSRASQPN